MTVNYFIHLATSADIPGILALQEKNLRESGGGLSARQTADWFKRMMAEMPLIVARRDNQVVGYIDDNARRESACGNRASYVA